MEISDIRVKIVNGDGKLKAYVSVTFNKCFVVHNMKVIEGKNGIFVAMPSRKTNKGEFKDVAHPINSDFRNHLQDEVLSAFYNAEEEQGDDSEKTEVVIDSEDEADVEALTE